MTPEIFQWAARNVKAVQLRSQTAGNRGTNEYKGEIVNMCEECRKSNNGTFKIFKSILTPSKEDARRQRAAKALYDETMATP